MTAHNSHNLLNKPSKQYICHNISSLFNPYESFVREPVTATEYRIKKVIVTFYFIILTFFLRIVQYKVAIAIIFSELKKKSGLQEKKSELRDTNSHLPEKKLYNSQLQVFSHNSKKKSPRCTLAIARNKSQNCEIRSHTYFLIFVFFLFVAEIGFRTFVWGTDWN